jgi:hypothetical protein
MPRRKRVQPVVANAFSALDALNLGDAVRSIVSEPAPNLRVGLRTPQGRWLKTVPGDVARSLRGVRRLELCELLCKELEPGTVHLNTAATVATDGSPIVEISKHDGSSSTVRLRYEQYPLATPHTRTRHCFGYSTWRGISEKPLDLRGEAGETWGRGERFGIVPLNDGCVYWFAVASMPESITFSNEYAEVHRRFAEWHEPISNVINATHPSSVIRHPIHDLAKPLPTFVRGRTVLLGDAAHAMTPDLGQGAGQAIEDAATLALLVGRTASGKDIDAALARYDSLRRPRTQRIAQRVRTFGTIAQIRTPLIVAGRNLALQLTPAKVLGNAVTRLQNWHTPG